MRILTDPFQKFYGIVYELQKSVRWRCLLKVYSAVVHNFVVWRGFMRLCYSSSDLTESTELKFKYRESHKSSLKECRSWLNKYSTNTMQAKSDLGSFPTPCQAIGDPTQLTWT